MFPARRPSDHARSEHLHTSYGSDSFESSVATTCGENYTLAQLREIVLGAMTWLAERGWSSCDTGDLIVYGPAVRKLGRPALQHVIDDLVRTEDVLVTVLTPPHCRRARPCYSLVTPWEDVQ